jgi:hypothetical protein
MPSKREAVHSTGTKTNSNLKPDFTFEQMQSLWDSIESCEHAIGARLQTDIDSDQYSERMGVSVNCARSRMKKLAKVHADSWMLVTVMDCGHTRKVLRQVKQ